MDLVTGAMDSLVLKLGELLKEEYKLQTGMRKDVESLSQELRSMHAALRKVADVPRDQLDEQVRLWAGEVRELSYNMEDVVDTFLVRVEGSKLATDLNGFKGLMRKMRNLFKRGKERHEIAHAIRDIKEQFQEVAARRARYRVDDVAANPAATITIDPRLRALYTDVTELVGIHGKRDQELMNLLSEGEQKPKIVSVVGFGGLGKTTLVRAVYDKIKGGFCCSAFVPVGRTPDVKKVFVDILLDLDKQKYTNFNLKILDERQLINELREFLKNKRYLIVIDDIWKEELWGLIKCAFSNGNNLGSRLITTTRIVSVSEACRSSSHDSIYQMKPLPDEDSQRLFNRRIFQSEIGCPPELQQVSRDILKKCGGVPLAIITIASLLASDQRIKPNDEWHVLLKSIGRGLTEDASVEEMQRILSFSYYDLPSHLKTCLLYLSIFPEDNEIKRDWLIWKWIAESFVQCKKQESSLFELGETYFNELINRSMIQAVYNREGRVEACRVHDMVLDLINSLSREENFVTIVDGNKDIMSSQSNARRLSLQNRERDYQTTPLVCMSISQVRSITIFPHGIVLMPPLSSFDVLRVLDLSRCNLGESSHLKLRNVEKLVHLRYLGLAETQIRELPAEIGKLQFLRVLDLRGNPNLTELPSSVSMLRRLMCLDGHGHRMSVWDGLGNLAYVEVLKGIRASSLNNVIELRNLVRLRELEIYFDWPHPSLEIEEAFVDSLCNLHNIQSVGIYFFNSVDLLGERWVPPRHLRKLDTMYDNVLSTLPAWIKRNPTLYSDLSKLRISVNELHLEDLRILGSLPALRSLKLWLQRDHQTQRLLLTGADGFQFLIFFGLRNLSPKQIMFEPGALPRAEVVEFSFYPRLAKGDFDLGLGNLLSLRDAKVTIYRRGVIVGEAKKAEAALSHALDVHPNHPSIEITFYPLIPEGADDDDVCA